MSCNNLLSFVSSIDPKTYIARCPSGMFVQSNEKSNRLPLQQLVAEVIHSQSDGFSDKEDLKNKIYNSVSFMGHVHEVRLSELGIRSIVIKIAECLKNFLSGFRFTTTASLIKEYFPLRSSLSPLSSRSEWGHKSCERLNSEKYQNKIPKENRLNTPVNDLTNQMLSEIFETNRGFVLGENHEEEFTKSFLTENMNFLHELGVRTIFTEFFFIKDQKELDDYIYGKGSDFPKNIKKRIDEIKKFNMLYNDNMLRAAKANQIRIVALDDPLADKMRIENTLYINSDSCWSRMHGFNYLAQKIIKREHHSQKFVVHVGAAHMTAYSQSDERKVPGIADIFEIPAIAMSPFYNFQRCMGGKCMPPDTQWILAKK
ncbi:MAG: hypothetical protein S4CHLAM123_13410 [Chlamydiales bacterium]|nr:hypothetical protein [Chlamydiales bacterium]